MLNKGSVLIISEHGGFLPLFEHEFFNHENKIADYHFISNDFKLASNNIKLPTVINIYKKTVFNFSKQKNLTFIHRECGLYNHRLCSNMPVPHIFIEFDYLINSIKYLKKEIKDNIKYKCINNTKAYFKENFSNKYGKEKIINPKEKYEITVKNSKILVHLYISTPFYESLHFNVPSLVLIPKTHWIFDKNFKKYIDDLEKKKILFYDPQKMSEHINNIWHNVEEWWLNQEIQSLIKKFLNSINFKDDDPVSRYLENLKKLPLNINVKN